MANSIGSTWGKWDLHVHTPASLFNRYGGDNDEVWERYIGDLAALPRQFRVLGINDYLFVEGYERVRLAKEQGLLPNIESVFPVIELRLDKFGGVVKKAEDGRYSQSDLSRINLHVIFDELPAEVIRQQFLSAIAPSYNLIPERVGFTGRWQAVITRQSLSQLGEMIIGSVPEEERGKFGSPLQEGFNALCVDMPSIQRALENHNLRNKFLLAIGKAEWENVKWNDNSIAEKKNIINSVDLVFTAAANPSAYHSSRKRLLAANVQANLLDCSDAHSFSGEEDKDRIGNCFTWIKADPTFQGLKQAVTEFDQRVFIGDTPPKLLLVASNRTKYVSALKIAKRPASQLAETWFDSEVRLNHDLVAIIGNKGSGKSALADVTALVGDTRNCGSFSFLRDNRFRDPRNNLAAHFFGRITWEDSATSEKNLSENPSDTAVERVKYLPQSYLEELCNALEVSGPTSFDAELRKIIYTHVPEEERLGYVSLDSLLDFKVSELEAEKAQIQGECSRINTEIADIERKLSRHSQESLRQKLEAKRLELQALEGAKPRDVEDPQSSEAARAEAEGAMRRIASLEESLARVIQDETALKAQKADLLKRAATIARVLQALRNQEKAFQQFTSEIGPLLRSLGIERVEDVASVHINAVPLENEAASVKRRIGETDAALGDLSEQGLVSRRRKAEADIERIRGELGEKERLFLVYKEQLSQWEKTKRDLIGDVSKVESIRWYEEEARKLELLPERRNELRERRREVVRRIHVQLGKVVEEYRKLYEPISRFVQSSESDGMTLSLGFDVRIAEEGFQSLFLERINRQVRGSFAGIDESNALIRKALLETDFSSTEAVVAFVEKVDGMLHFDQREGAAATVELSVDAQLRKGNTAEELYDFIFGLSYLRPRYSLTYNQQEIAQLSPGERGLLLLVFYLLVDKDDIPLVIDQPEENLDNQTIYKVLVRCIKAAKARRQVIMVTHNPNLAVVCDAEQIIYAECDKAAKQFRYESGAIEAPAIRKRLVEILEGTEPAFVNRKRKYGL